MAAKGKGKEKGKDKGQDLSLIGNKGVPLSIRVSATGFCLFRCGTLTAWVTEAPEFIIEGLATTVGLEVQRNPPYLWFANYFEQTPLGCGSVP